jgi:Tfp pilus assembly protein PilF
MLSTRVLFLLAASAPLPAAAQNAQARDFYQQGVQALSDRQFEQARQALARAVALDPDFAGRLDGSGPGHLCRR